MVRKAAVTDLDSIEEGYREHFAHEREHGAYTVFREGVYPTRMTAEQALRNGSLYVYEEEGAVLGSIILDEAQPEEYQRIDWPSRAPAGRVKVIHLLMVRPGAAGRGVGSALVRHVLKTAGEQSCLAVRLDTGAQNIPAASLYRKLGFRLVSASSMKVGGMIAHKEHLFFEKEIALSSC